MIIIQLDTTNLESRITDMINKLDDTRQSNVPSEMTAWQMEDLNRNKPNMTQTNIDSYMTRLWARATERVRRKVSSKAKISRGRAAPILRRSMYDRLHERMSSMMQIKLTWR